MIEEAEFQLISSMYPELIQLTPKSYQLSITNKKTIQLFFYLEPIQVKVEAVFDCLELQNQITELLKDEDVLVFDIITATQDFLTQKNIVDAACVVAETQTPKIPVSLAKKPGMTLEQFLNWKSTYIKPKINLSRGLTGRERYAIYLAEKQNELDNDKGSKIN